MKLKFLIPASAAILLTMGACSNETPVNPAENVINKGETTYASFAISLPQNETRAASTDEGLPEEQAIEQVHLYIFDTGILEAHALRKVDTNGRTEAVKVSTGEKVIYAITTESVTDGATGLTNNGDPIKVVVDGEEGTATTLTEFERQLFDAMPANIAEENRFVMIGRGQEAILKTTEANPQVVSINIDRASAKTSLTYDEEQVKVRPTLCASFGTPYYAINQRAKRMYITLADGLYTFNGTEDTNGSYNGFSNTSSLNFKKVFASLTNPTMESFEYMAENVNSNPVTGNTTYAMLRLQVTPSNIYDNAAKDASTGKVVLTEGTYTAGNDFWVVAKHDAVTGSYVFASDAAYNLMYFSTEAAANAYIEAKELPASAVTDYHAICYTKGQAYYRINFITDANGNLSAKYCVLRNHYYKVSVSEIKALGAHTPDGTVPENPDEPIEPEGWLVAEIIEQPWTVCDMSDIVLQ